MKSVRLPLFLFLMNIVRLPAQLYKGFLVISAHVLPDVWSGEKTKPREIPQPVRDPDET